MASRPLRCKCGHDEFTENRRSLGWWAFVVDGHGNIIDTDDAKVELGPVPKTVVCNRCDRRNPNPRLAVTSGK